MRMKILRTVPIYTDPSTRMCFEGEAYLIKKLWTHECIEFWKVEFAHDGHRCHRAIARKPPSQPC